MIRNNANLLVVFKQNNTNLELIYDDYINTDFTFEDFRHICLVCWLDKDGFLSSLKILIRTKEGTGKVSILTLNKIPTQHKIVVNDPSEIG